MEMPHGAAGKDRTGRHLCSGMFPGEGLKNRKTCLWISVLHKDWRLTKTAALDWNSVVDSHVY